MSEMFLPRFMIAAPNSGSGKTTVVCALLKALLDQEYKVAAFKSGPDYDRNINCLIIYSHQDCDEIIEIKHFIYDEKNDMKVIQKESGYVNLYKLGIKLPEIT